VKLDYTPTKDDFVSAINAVSEKNNERLWTLDLLYLPLLLLYLYLILEQPAWPSLVNYLLTFLLLGFPPFAYTRIYLSGKQVARQVQQAPQLLGLTTWELTPEHLTITNSLSEIKLAWDTFGSVLENQNFYFLLYAANRNILQFLPKRALAGRAEDEAAFRAALQEKLGAIRSAEVGPEFRLALYALGALYLAAILSFFYASFSGAAI
jgi:hypothetical protein